MIIYGVYSCTVSVIATIIDCNIATVGKIYS